MKMAELMQSVSAVVTPKAPGLKSETWGTCILGALPLLGFGQAAPSPAIPDVSNLLKQVQEHRLQTDALRRNYTYREIETTQNLDQDGAVKKTEVNENDVSFVNTHQVKRLMRKNGKNLTLDEENREQARIRKEIAKMQKTPPDRGSDCDTVSILRLLSIMKVSNPRRIVMNSRPTLVFDFAGDPHAQTHDLAENASKQVAGTIWIDEEDREVLRLEARFDDNFEVGWGLASVAKGGTFTFDERTIRDQLWLPAGAQVHMVAHALGILG